MVSPRDGAHGALYREGFHRNLNHSREALARQIYFAREEPPGYGVNYDRDKKQQVHEIHRFILVDPEKADPIKPRERVDTRREVTQE